MLPTPRKLHTADFKQMRGARLIASTHFILHWKKADGAPSRFAVVTAATVSSSAVVRNKIRRQIFAALRSVLPELRDGHLIAIRAKRGAAELSGAEKRREVLALLVQAGVLVHTPFHFEGGGK